MVHSRRGFTAKINILLLIMPTRRRSPRDVHRDLIANTIKTFSSNAIKITSSVLLSLLETDRCLRKELYDEIVKSF